MNLSERPIAMTDLETTGDVFGEHEIIEIGLVLFDQKTFKIINTLNIKVKPEHIENAIPKARERNGYNKENWKEAFSLNEAIKMFAEKTKDSVFCSYNVSFDWGFMNEAFRKTKIKNEMDYHRLDLMTLAWEKGMKKQGGWSLKNSCEFFGIKPEPEIHTAINGAMTAYELFKKLESK